MADEEGQYDGFPAMLNGPALGLPRLSLAGKAARAGTEGDALSKVYSELAASWSADRGRPPPMPAPGDWREWLESIPIGKYVGWESGDEWRLRLIDNHILIAGIMGAGKGSVIWSLIVGVAPAVMAGVVELWGLDPKRSELSLGRGIFERYASTSRDMLELLEEAVAAMEARSDQMAGRVRKFTPSAQTPLIVAVIDELGFLSALQDDPKLQRRASKAVTTLLALGRSAGFVVVGALQDPRKSTLDNRDLFATFVAMRLPRSMADLVLGHDAYELGARCDAIPLGPRGAGIAYVRGDDSTSPREVRAYWVSDKAIKQTEAVVVRALKEPRAAQPRPGTSPREPTANRPASRTPPSSAPKPRRPDVGWKSVADQEGDS